MLNSVVRMIWNGRRIGRRHAQRGTQKAEHRPSRL
jgi:hypothetical protein